MKHLVNFAYLLRILFMGLVIWIFRLDRGQA